MLRTLFWLLTLALWLEYVASRRVSRYLLALVFFALGHMSKPHASDAPFTLLLLDYWPLGRLKAPLVGASGTPFSRC